MPQYNESYFFSSDPAAGALNVSSDGTQFTVQLSDPLGAPSDAKACHVGVVTGSIWNNSPNIGPGLGPAGVDDNKFQYTTSTGTPGTYNITFPTGQYSIAAISSYLATAFVNNGHAANLFVIGGQAATGLSTLTILTLGDWFNSGLPRCRGSRRIRWSDGVRNNAGPAEPCEHLLDLKPQLHTRRYPHQCKHSRPTRSHTNHREARFPNQLPGNERTLDACPRHRRQEQDKFQFPAHERGRSTRTNRRRLLEFHDSNPL